LFQFECEVFLLVNSNEKEFSFGKLPTFFLVLPSFPVNHIYHDDDNVSFFFMTIQT